MAALLVVSGVLFALSATAVTPLSASTSNQHIQNQQLVTANDVLAAADENGTLRESVLFWNGSQRRFHAATGNGFYTQGGPPTPFGESLNETFRDGQIAFNVYVAYWDGQARNRQPMVYMGAPSDNSVRASRTLTLYDDDELSAPGQDGNVSSSSAFYAPDLEPGNRLYNVVEVQITAWRM